MPNRDASAALRTDPPLTTSFKWCPVCGRDDRHLGPFTGKSHFSGGKKCLGKPVVVVYEFKEILRADA